MSKKMNADEWDPTKVRPGTIVEVKSGYERITKKNNLAIGCNRIPVRLVEKHGGSVDRDKREVTARLTLANGGRLVLPGMARRGYFGWSDYAIHDYATTVKVVDERPELDRTTITTWQYPGLYLCANGDHAHHLMLTREGKWRGLYFTEPARYASVTEPTSTPELDCVPALVMYIEALSSSDSRVIQSAAPVETTIYRTMSRLLWDRVRDLPREHPARIAHDSNQGPSLTNWPLGV